MTTVAWDGKSMAADRMMTFGTTPVPTSKLHRITFQKKPAILGFSGTADEFIPLLQWLKKPKGDAPLSQDRQDWSAMVVLKSGEVFYAAGKPVFISLGKITWSIGSGGDYAMGAMDFGATAEEAVAIACARDTASGLGIDVETF